MSGADDRTLRVWDAQSGRCLIQMVLVSATEAAVIDPQTQRFIWASADAWPYVGWRVFDPEAQRIRILPAEYFGELSG